ncbi:oligosaccharide flippase family protein [Georgenia satyanarayanai]|nr:oligosaccharide flippase family protein [Georgenia satyanarayanai]
MPGSTTTVLRGVAQLSLGTALIRGVAGASQFVLAIWLVPADFGHWAAAVSATAFVSALMNFGLVDGYLARQGLTFGQLLRQTTIANVLLGVAALGVAGAYLLVDRPVIALLVVVAAINIPLTGLSEVLTARRLRHRRYRSIVSSQAVAAATKLGLGAAVAAVTASPLAIGLSTVAFSIVMIIFLAPARGLGPEPKDDTPYVPRARYKWAGNALATKLTLNLGFFVAQFLTTAEVLGLYYLSFQAVLAVSGVVAPPLKRVALNSLAAIDDTRRASIAQSLSILVNGCTVVGCATLGLFAPVLTQYVPQAWEDALPAALIFLSILPSRMLSPIIDAYQQARNEWWLSTRFHILDGIVVSIAAVSATTGDVTILALTICASRLALISVRTARAYGTDARAKARLTASTVFTSATLLIGTAPGVHPAFLVVPLVTGFAIISSYVAPRRRRRASSQPKSGGTS